MYDAIIVGAGFAGAVVAERLANKYHKCVLVLEKRKHVGGNMYDEVDQNGFLIQRYGPHLFFTNDTGVLDYVSQFTKLIPHDCVMFSFLDRKYVQLPFNFKSVQQMLGYKKAEPVIKAIKENYPCTDRISIFDLMNDSHQEIRDYANLLYKKAFETYICKQWGLRPEQISKDVINRCKFSPNYTNRYLDKDYQYLPDKGFTVLIQKMLTNRLIKVQTNCDATKRIKIQDGSLVFDGQKLDIPVIYTGPIDELFSFSFGALPYRSLHFVTHYYNKRRVLPIEIVSMPQDKRFIRKTEYKYFTPKVTNEDVEKSVVVTEEPFQYDPTNPKAVQCYPIINDQDNALYQKYFAESTKIPNLHLCGRLAEYKYFNMDIVIRHAMECADSLIE